MVEFLRDVVIVLALLLGFFALADDRVSEFLSARALAPTAPEVNSAGVAPIAPVPTINTAP